MRPSTTMGVNDIGPGEEVAKALYDAHFDSIYRQVMAACRDPDLARGATQEAFTRAFEQYDGLRDKKRFSSWATKIALNVAMDALRRQQRETPTDMSQPTRESSDEISDIIAAKEESGRLHALVNNLPVKLKDLVVIHYFWGYSVRDASRLVGVPVGTVKSRLSRARRMLRKMMKGEGPKNRAAPRPPDNRHSKASTYCCSSGDRQLHPSR